MIHSEQTTKHSSLTSNWSILTSSEPHLLVKISTSTCPQSTLSTDDISVQSYLPATQCRRSDYGWRWDAQDKSDDRKTGLPTAITLRITSEQLDAYVTVFRVSKITEQLCTNDLTPCDRPRSPSPEPECNSTGRRINTREQRYRKRLEEERYQLAGIALRTIPAYVPPYDHRQPPTKISEKVYLLVTDFPAVNFIGQILGPRGSSLKAVNARSSAHIVIRGRGSVKEGKGKSRQSAADYDTEPLHCLITTDSQHQMNVARKLIQDMRAGL
ncbi:hypothetical protein B0T10DRAFT_458999 [Thelonectria olida]|uniref:Branchpoint-bridging protein n=1 Tax=Thelonectria olida TaxID=1576542 RepID=A0A9P9AQD3_9HYPO|nr:hypothetical protein B0T10DRAFT_458999 [Thelonectria olida]